MTRSPSCADARSYESAGGPSLQWARPGKSGAKTPLCHYGFGKPSA